MTNHRAILKESFATFGEFIAAVASEETIGDARHDPRLQMVATALGINEGFGTQGGYLVPAEFLERLWTRVIAAGSIINRCDRVPLKKNAVIPAIADGASKFGGVQTFWTDEAAPAPQTGVEFAQLKLELKKLVALVFLTDELAQDAGLLAVTIERLFARSAAFKIESEIVKGGGAGTPLGVLNSGALITVAKDGSQAAGSITATNLSSMVGRLWGPSHKRAVWLMSNDAFGKILELEGEGGAPLIETGPDNQRLLHQMPIELCEYTAPLGNAGDILLADFSQYLLAERDSDFLSSIHVRFVQDESCFKFRYRLDGQPAWATPVTPENSGNTQSPFVTLEARD